MSLVFMSRFVLGPFRPLLRLVDPTLRTAAEAGVDVMQLATNKAYTNERGYFTLLQKDDSSPDSRDEGKQHALWVRSAEWVGITPEKTALAI